MDIIKTKEEYEQWRKDHSGSLGFVPTMGALHDGHASLLVESIKNNDFTVLSIYVNPTQFGINEDLSNYPRTLEADLEIAKKCGVSAVYLPTSELLYPEGYSTYITVESVSEPLCGVFRPGHFRGVATIVLKLFNLLMPTVAYFGMKDAQQFLVIQRMALDLNLNIKIVGVPTAREKSGLALSSRNVYLSDMSRESVAPKIYKQLSSARAAIQTGKDIGEVLKSSIAQLTADGFEVQYFELRTLPDLNLFSVAVAAENSEPKLIIACAAYLPSKSGGKVRLIDNVIF